MSRYTFKHLKYLEWWNFPCKSLDNIDMGNVVVINLQNSKLEKIWEGVKVKQILTYFSSFSITKIPRGINTQDEALNMLAVLSFDQLGNEILVEVIKEKSILQPAGFSQAETVDTWMTPIFNYLSQVILPHEKKESLKSGAMPSCTLSVAAKALRMGNYCPSFNRDAKAELKTCKECHAYANIQRVPKHNLIPITTPWPFHQWDIDICGPFPTSLGNVKQMIVVVDYFTKWVEANH
ncbi:reverse transcriptase domain-containing protein [Tanacetum coccineum]